MSGDTSSAALHGRKRQKPKDKGLVDISGELLATGGDESVCVCIRVRPFNRRERELQTQLNPQALLRSVVEIPDGVAGKLRLLEPNDQGDFIEGENFQFTKTFWSIPEEQQPHKYLPITQEDIFDVVGRMVLTNALGGFNVCVFAYGQTGSGKTHTMMGDFHTENGEFSGDPGLIPRLCRELFLLVKKKKSETESENARVKLDIDVKLSALEIYNEQVRDLFWKGSPFPNRTKNSILRIRLHPTEGHFVEQLTTLNPRTWEECIQQIAAGVSERTVAATLMNDESSRSHSVFQISVVQTETIAPPPDQPYEKPIVTTRTSRINLVDLAGSERLKKSGAQGQQLKEAAGINQSLSTLKKVIDALVTNGTEKNPKKQVVIPYRESALTQLLSHSLGGNSKTTMIACVSPHADNLEETRLTLRYANRTKGIVNHVKSNEDNSAKQAKLLKDQLAILQAKLSEGPTVYDEKQLAELRDQLEVGNQALEEMRQRQYAVIREAEVLQKELEEQQKARFSATYYHCFKRVLLERLRDQSQGKLKALETTLQRAAGEKEQLNGLVTIRERSVREAEYTIQELKRREEVAQLRAARSQALARQLVRDIAKNRKKVDHNLMSRFGLVWVKNKSEKDIRQQYALKKDSILKDHEQYLQSIVREGKKQFDFLVATYADKEASQRERLENVERSRKHAQGQLEKAQHVFFTLQNNIARAREEHEHRERERLRSWEKRFTDMETLYLEKISSLENRKAVADQQWTDRIEHARQKAYNEHACRIDDLRVCIDKADHEGAKRCSDVENDMDQQLREVLRKCEKDASKAADELYQQFLRDEKSLIETIHTAEESLLKKRSMLQELYNYASALESAAQHVDAALQRAPPTGPTDYQILRRDAETFLSKYREYEPYQFGRAAAVLRKSIALV